MIDPISNVITTLKQEFHNASSASLMRMAIWKNIKPEKGFSFYHRGIEGVVGGGFNSGVPLIPGLLGLMGQKEERDGSSDK